MGRLMRSVTMVGWGVAVVLGCALPEAGAQTLSYSKGQIVLPAYEGWEERADGSRWFVFGYMNRNWEEEVDVPIGPSNTFNLGADLGQPTHFLPRRNRFMFRVPVPKHFTDKDELIWTLTTQGQTMKAYGTLRVDYKMDDMIIASETGALGAGSSSPEVRANTPPVVTIQGAQQITVRVGQPIELVSVLKDDGIPRRRASGLAGAAVSNAGSRSDAAVVANANPNAPVRVNRAMAPPFRVTVGKNVGLHNAWFVYRGDGPVRFDPEQPTVWEDTRAGANSPWAPIWAPPDMPADGRVTVKATFAEPGTYTLRSRADDGALTGDDEITVTVIK